MGMMKRLYSMRTAGLTVPAPLLRAFAPHLIPETAIKRVETDDAPEERLTSPPKPKTDRSGQRMFQDSIGG